MRAEIVARLTWPWWLGGGSKDPCTTFPLSGGLWQTSINLKQDWALHEHTLNREMGYMAPMLVRFLGAQQQLVPSQSNCSWRHILRFKIKSHTGNSQRTQPQKGFNVAHFDKVVLQDLMRCEPLGGVKLEHGLEHVHKHQPICLLHHFVCHVAVAESCLQNGETTSTLAMVHFLKSNTWHLVSEESLKELMDKYLLLRT